MNSLSRVLEPKYIGSWRRIQENQPGTIEVMYKMEQYASVLAHNMLQLFTQPFDAINDNIGEIFSHLLNEGKIFVTKHQ